jgi:hypothetical protein
LPVEQAGQRVGSRRVGELGHERADAAPHVSHDEAASQRRADGHEPALGGHGLLDRGHHDRKGGPHQADLDEGLRPLEEVEGEHSDPDEVEAEDARTAAVEVHGQCDLGGGKGEDQRYEESRHAGREEHERDAGQDRQGDHHEQRRHVRARAGGQRERGEGQSASGHVQIAQRARHRRAV